MKTLEIRYFKFISQWDNFVCYVILQITFG